MAEHFEGGNEGSCQDTMTSREPHEQQQIGDQEHQQVDEQKLAVRRSDNQDQTTGEEQMLAVRRSDNQDQTTGEEQMLAVRRSDSQDQTAGVEQTLAVRRSDNQTTGEEQTLAVRRSDNQDQTAGEEQMLAVRRSDNQDQTVSEIVPFAPIPELSQTAVVQQISGSGNVAISSSASGSVININQFPASAKAGTLENQPSTSQEPTRQGAAAQTSVIYQECSSPKMMKLTSLAQENAAADSCEKELKDYYTSRGSYVQILEEEARHIKGIYTKLEIAEDGKSKCRPNKKGGPLKSYEDFFSFTTEGGKPIKICVLSGSPGSGKSTLFVHMTHDWADDSYPKCAIKQYKLVVSLKMHALVQDSDLIDAIFDQLLAEDTGIERSDLKSYIKKNPGRVLILLDGFDELMTTSLNESSFGSILKILTQKMCRGCSVLITTRTSHCDRLVTQQLVQEPFAHVKVLGFNENSIREYVHKFFSEVDEYNSDGLLERITNSYILSNLAECPMLLLLMCLLWRDDSTLSETMSHLYRDAARYIFRRRLKADEKQNKIAKVMIEIGKVGLHGLFSPDQRLSFKECEFDKSVLEMALQAGILIRHTVRKGLDTHNCVQFIHKSFQEFCAAKYMQSLFVVDTKEFMKILVNDIMSKGPEGFEYLLRFCCGDNEACTGMILRVLQESFPKDLSYRHSLGVLAVHCYFEGQLKSLPPKEVMNSICSDAYMEIDNAEFQNSVTYFLNHVADQTKCSGNAYLAKVRTLRFTGNILAWFNSLDFPLSAMTNLSRVIFDGCQFTEHDIKHVVETLQDLPNLVQLCLYDDMGGQATSWLVHLQQFRHLQKLDILSWTLVGPDIEYVAKALPNLVELKLQRCPLGGTAVYWSAHLKQLKHLQGLILYVCCLTVEDMQHIAKSLCDLPDLVELDISDNKDLVGTVFSWSTHLKKLQHLQTLSLSWCPLEAEDIMYIAQALPNLVKLILPDSSALGGNAAVWSQHLKKLKHLQTLGLAYTSLIAEDIKYVAQALPNLVGLSLGGNHRLGGDAADWSKHLKQLKHLQKLRLDYCSLTKYDIPHVAEAVPGLVKLNLSSNIDLVGTASEWCRHLKKFQCLQKLKLCAMTLTGQDKKSISESLSDLIENGLVIRYGYPGYELKL